MFRTAGRPACSSKSSTRTLLCGDLFTHVGNGVALVESDIVAPAMAAEEVFHATAITPMTAPAIRKLADLEPRTLGVMHGSSYRGDCGTALRALADHYAGLLDRALRQQTLAERLAR